MSGPQHTAMMAIRLPRRSASSIKCVVSRMVRPARYLLFSSHLCCHGSHQP